MSGVSTESALTRRRSITSTAVKRLSDHDRRRTAASAIAVQRLDRIEGRLDDPGREPLLRHERDSPVPLEPPPTSRSCPCRILRTLAWDGGAPQSVHGFAKLRLPRACQTRNSDTSLPRTPKAGRGETRRRTDRLDRELARSRKLASQIPVIIVFRAIAPDHQSVELLFGRALRGLLGHQLSVTQNQ